METARRRVPMIRERCFLRVSFIDLSALQFANMRLAESAIEAYFSPA